MVLGPGFHRAQVLTTFSDSSKTSEEKAREEEEKILAAIANQRKLASDLELAKGIQYTEAMKTT